MRKLILVTPELGSGGGGIATLTRLLIPAVDDYCRQHDIAFEVWSLGHPSPLRFPVRYFGGSQARLALALWRTALDRPRPHVIATHIGPMRAFGVLPGGVRPRYLLFLLGVEIWRNLDHSRRRTLSGAACLLAISDYTRRRVHQHHPWLTGVDVLHLALETQPVSGAPDADLLARLGTDYALIVGRLDARQRHKGHDDLLATWPLVREHRPAARLVITGQGDDADRLKARAAALGIADSVIFTGFVDDATLAAIFARCRVFAMPSTGDGFGFVYLEAMAQRKPCIGLRESSAAEIIVDGVTGLLVDHGDHDALAAALIRFLSDPTFAEACGTRGYDRLQAHFTPAAFTDRLTPQLDKLINSQAR